MSFAGLELTLVGLGIFFGMVTVILVTLSLKNVEDFMPVAFFAFLAMVAFVVFGVFTAFNRSKTLQAKQDISKAGLEFNSLSVSGHAITIDAAGCQFYLTMEKRGGHYSAYLQKSDGSQIVATPEKLTAMCEASK
jgi:hypothetical protein